jgi:hypothetical protein
LPGNKWKNITGPKDILDDFGDFLGLLVIDFVYYQNKADFSPCSW